MSTKPFYLSKTLWVNFLSIVAVLLVYVSGADFPIQLTAEQLQVITGVLAVVNIGLRFVTDKAIGQ